MLPLEILSIRLGAIMQPWREGGSSIANQIEEEMR